MINNPVLKAPDFNNSFSLYCDASDVGIGAVLIQSDQYDVKHPVSFYRRIVLGFEGEKNMPKLNFSGNLPNTIRNNIPKLPVIPAGAFSNIQDGVQDGRQNVNSAI